MNQVILIIDGESPRLINVADDAKSVRWNLTDGSELDVDIMTACVRNLHGEESSYLIATNIDDISPAEIKLAAEALYPRS